MTSTRATNAGTSDRSRLVNARVGWGKGPRNSSNSLLQALTDIAALFVVILFLCVTAAAVPLAVFMLLVCSF